MMAYWNRDHYYMHRAEEHLVRFREGSACMGLTFPWSVEQLFAGIMELLKHEPERTQYIRPIAFRGAPELWITGSEGRPADVSIFTVRTDQHRDLDAPISCEFSSVERFPVARSRVRSKSAALTSTVSWRAGWRKRAAPMTALCSTATATSTEASAANVFLISGDRLITPRIKVDVFPGITRDVVIEIARDKGIDVQEAELRREDLASMDGAFLCSTLMEIRGLSKLGAQSMSTVELPVYKTVVRAFRVLTRQ